jgi:LacI family transcriptional regulator
MQKSKKRVAILIESTRSYARELILGVGQYQREHGNWEVEFSPRGLVEPLPDWLKTWQGDGILARIDNRGLTSQTSRQTSSRR